MRPAEDRLYRHLINWQQWARVKHETKIFNISINAQQGPLSFLQEESVRARLAAARVMVLAFLTILSM